MWINTLKPVENVDNYVDNLILKASNVYNVVENKNQWRLSTDFV